jgi:predicted RND superfamily exporter protein
MAIVTIIGIVACVLGMCHSVFDWELGIAESIAAVIVIGFAVDFTVHLASMYVESAHVRRADRMADSARTMGVTVVMGGVTTMGAGLFMAFCTVTFFTKFCVLICSTIAFSLAAALLFFMPLVATLGPEEGYGDLNVICAQLTLKQSRSDPSSKSVSEEP